MGMMPDMPAGPKAGPMPPVAEAPSLSPQPLLPFSIPPPSPRASKGYVGGLPSPLRPLRQRYEDDLTVLRDVLQERGLIGDPAFGPYPTAQHDLFGSIKSWNGSQPGHLDIDPDALAMLGQSKQSGSALLEAMLGQVEETVPGFRNIFYPPTPHRFSIDPSDVQVNDFFRGYMEDDGATYEMVMSLIKAQDMARKSGRIANDMKQFDLLMPRVP
jgi:hypothetical protein